MKGIVFTEFLELVDSKFGIAVTDEIIQKSNLNSRGIYTAVGTYDHMEIIELVSQLSNVVNIESSQLLYLYGEYFFSTLYRSYPHFFKGINDPFELLISVDSHIHVEVKKLYPDAELPKFKTELNGNVLLMDYFSERKMGDFAMGLIKQCMTHYGKSYKLTKRENPEDPRNVVFEIRINE